MKTSYLSILLMSLSAALLSTAFLFFSSQVAVQGIELLPVDTEESGNDHPNHTQHHAPQAPGISLEKTVGLDPNSCASEDNLLVNPGTKVTYCYRVTNTGDTALGRQDLDDSELGSLLNNFSYNLSPAASAFLTATATLTQTTTNTATWTAYNPGPVDEVSAVDSVTVVVREPAISLTATVGLDPNVCAVADALTVEPGSAVAYCFSVTNSGTLTLTLHDLVDTVQGPILAGLPYSLVPGASVFLTTTATITQTTTNTATWTAYNPGPVDTVESSDSLRVTILYRNYLPAMQRANTP